MIDSDLNFDEKAVEYIKSHIDPEISELYSDDDILLVVDTIFDYYDSKGLLDIDLGDDEPDEVDVDDLVAYVAKQLRKDRDNRVAPEHVEPIVKAEIDFEIEIDEE